MLILVIFCQDIFVNIFNNVPFHFVELFLRGSYLKPEISKIISQNVFSLVPGDVLIDPHKVFEVFVDIDSNLSMSKDAYLALVALSS